MRTTGSPSKYSTIDWAVIVLGKQQIKALILDLESLTDNYVSFYVVQKTANVVELGTQRKGRLPGRKGFLDDLNVQLENKKQRTSEEKARQVLKTLWTHYKGTWHRGVLTWV